MAYVFLAILVLLFFILNICIGSVNIPFRQIPRILTGQSMNETWADIVLQLRFPRAMAALILGGGLSLSGYLLQTFFHNPIAGPFVLGISSGAKLIVALFMVFCLSHAVSISSVGMVAAAFSGSMISMGFVLLISKAVDRMSMLIVGGVMIGYICNAVTEFVVTFADDSNIVNLHNWSMGSFSGITWGNVAVMAVVIFAATFCVFLMSKPISAYQLGEAYAANMGVRIPLFRAVLVLLSSVLSACVTAFAGPVSFVGVAVPHLIQYLFRTAIPILIIPAGFLGGSAFCLFCDLLARVVFAPTELSISAVTAVFGAPVVIAVMVRRGRQGQENSGAGGLRKGKV